MRASIGLLPGCPFSFCLTASTIFWMHVLRGGDQHLLSGDVLESTRHNTKLTQDMATTIHLDILQFPNVRVDVMI